MNSTGENICQAIEIIANDAVKNAGYDRTVQAQIISCVDQDAGKYKIKYQDSYSYAYSTSPDIHYSNSTYVYVQVPNGDMTKTKTILSAVENSTVEYGIASELEDEYDKIGNNCITYEKNPYPIEMCSAELNVNKILYDSTSKNNKINIDINALTEHIKNADSVLCGAVFGTNFDIEPISGDYGLRFILDFDDPNSTEENSYNSKTFEINTSNMIGNPYCLSNEVRQYQIFNVDWTAFKQIRLIQSFVKFSLSSIENPKNEEIRLHQTIHDVLGLRDIGSHLLHQPRKWQTGNL